MPVRWLLHQAVYRILPANCHLAVFTAVARWPTLVYGLTQQHPTGIITATMQS